LIRVDHVDHQWLFPPLNGPSRIPFGAATRM
jgi:hypothetical protein